MLGPCATLCCLCWLLLWGAAGVRGKKKPPPAPRSPYQRWLDTFLRRYEDYLHAFHANVDWLPKFDVVLQMQVEYRQRWVDPRPFRVGVVSQGEAATLVGHGRWMQAVPLGGTVPAETVQGYVRRFLQLVASGEDHSTGVYDCAPRPASIFCLSPTLVGFPAAWNASIVMWKKKNPKQLHYSAKEDVVCNPEPFELLVVIDWHRPVPLTYYFKHPQVRVYMPSEPLRFFKPKPIPPDYCTVQIDNYGHILSRFAKPGTSLTVAGIRVPLSYVYPVEQLRDAFKVALGQYAGPERLVWMPQRSHGHVGYEEVLDGLRQRNFTVQIGDLSSTIGAYYRTLAAVKYVVLPLRARASSGQMAADAAIMGVPAFAEHFRYMSRLTQHPALHYYNYSDLYARLARLEANASLYREARWYVAAAAARLEYRSAIHPRLLRDVLCHLSGHARQCCR